MNRLVRFLASPQSACTSYATAFRSALWVSAFVGLFLAVFQPFDLSDILGPYRLWLMASYGLPCLVPDILLGFLLVWWLRRDGRAARWVVWKQLVIVFGLLFVIGASNYLYNCWLWNYAFCWEHFWQMEWETALVGVFPAFGTFFIARYVLVRRNERDADLLASSIVRIDPPASAAPKLILLRGSGHDEEIRIDPTRLCYIKSEGNYVELALADADGKPERVLLRATLKDIETQLAGGCADVIRCHRSYLVNRARICGAEGNAMGLTLTLDRGGLQVPVSRSFVDLFRP